jgi:hypothetical protein
MGDHQQLAVTHGCSDVTIQGQGLAASGGTSSARVVQWLVHWRDLQQATPT